MTLHIAIQHSLDQLPVDLVYSPSRVAVAPIPSSELLYNWRTTIESVADVTTEVQIRLERAVRINPNSTIIARDYLAVGIQSNSTIYNDMRYPTGYCALGVNETYVLTRSPHLTEFPVGSHVSFTISYMAAAGRQAMNLTLTVVNHVIITDNLLPRLVAGRGIWTGEFPFETYQDTDFFLVDLDKTFVPVLDSVALHLDAYGINLDPSIHINIDRLSLINPYNLMGSASAISQIELQLRNALSDVGRLYNYLSPQLVGLDGTATVQRLTYVYLIIPVCFLAAYLSLTINEVTYDQRRREIGLLLTRGFSEPQILGVFALEVSVTALCSSVVGLGLAVFLVSFLTGVLTTAWFVAATVGLDTIVLTILVGVGLAATSTLLPARKALRIHVSEALRDYAPRSPWSIGEKHWFVWVSFILGSYYLVLLFFGINLEYVVTQVWSISVLLSSLLLVLAGINALLMWVGPFLFFYGFTAVIVRHSRRFYRVLERVVNRLATNLGSVAAHTVQRNPRRISAVVFLTALLVGYGVHVIGNSAIYNDVLTRSIYLQVGADIRVEVAPTANQTELLAAIESMEGIQAATVQTTFIIDIGDTEAEIRVIKVNEWRTIAYYEPGWFPLVPAEQALDTLNATPQGIILEHQLAAERGLSLNDTFTIDTLGTESVALRIVGFFGPSSGVDGQRLVQDTWSYVGQPFLNLTNNYPRNVVILASLSSLHGNSHVMDAIESLEGVSHIDTVSTQLVQHQTETTFYSLGEPLIQLSLIFSYILVSLGLGIIMYLTLHERRRTTALMTIRGTSFHQLLRILLSEWLPLIAFATLLGLTVGIIQTHGIILLAQQSVVPLQLITKRFLPLPSLLPMILRIGTYIGVLFLATLIPVTLHAYRHQYDLSSIQYPIHYFIPPFNPPLLFRRPFFTKIRL